MSNEQTSSKRPTHTAYSVREYTKNGQKESDWTRIGVAWAHKDGDGFDIILDAFPIDGRVALRKNKPKPEQA
jgi:hypothetical protein